MAAKFECFVAIVCALFVSVAALDYMIYQVQNISIIIIMFIEQKEWTAQM